MDDGNRNAAMAYYKGGGADGAPGKSKVKADIANDDFRKRAMAAYSAKGKTATMEAASTLKTSSVSTKQSLGMGRGGRGGGWAARPAACPASRAAPSVRPSRCLLPAGDAVASRSQRCSLTRAPARAGTTPTTTRAARSRARAT